MPAASFSHASPDARPVRNSRRAWFLAIAGLFAGGCATVAISAVAAAPVGLLVGLAWQHVAPTQQAMLAFDGRTPASRAQILRGVSGEAIQASTAQLDVADLSPAVVLDNGNLTPVALDRLSSGDCISLTIASGQKLSFHIVGAEKSDLQHNRSGSSNIELSVTPCSPNSEIILKAVIEKAQPKESAVQRNL
jgi:hypothetical protein